MHTLALQDLDILPAVEHVLVVTLVRRDLGFHTVELLAAAVPLVIRSVDLGVLEDVGKGGLGIMKLFQSASPPGSS